MKFFSSTFFVVCVISFFSFFVETHLVMVPKKMATYFSWFDTAKNQSEMIVRSENIDEDIVIEKLALLEKLLDHSDALMNLHKQQHNSSQVTYKECVFGVPVDNVRAHIKEYKEFLGIDDRTKRSVNSNDVFINNTTTEQTFVLNAGSSCSIVLPE